MNKFKLRWPSAGLIVGTVALVMAMGGVGYAASGSGRQSAAPAANTSSAGSLIAYALVNANGTVNPAHAVGITNSNIKVEPLATFCFHGLPKFKFAQVTPAWESNANSASKSVELGFPNGPNGSLVKSDCAGIKVQAEVVTEQGAANDYSSVSGWGHHAFFIALYN